MGSRDLLGPGKSTSTAEEAQTDIAGRHRYYSATKEGLETIGLCERRYAQLKHNEKNRGSRTWERRKCMREIDDEVGVL